MGTFSLFTYITSPSASIKARVGFRDDGQLRQVQATGDTRASAQCALKKQLTQQDNQLAGIHDLSADSTIVRLVKVWLADLDLIGRPAPSTRDLYERDMRQLVMPAFEHLLLREITVRKVDQFIKALAANRSFSMIVDEACIKDVTPHALRRTVATVLDRASGADLAADMLGHTSSKTTKERYIEPDETVNPVTAEILDALAPKTTLGSSSINGQ